ncbi:TIGR02206 family membrane protein [Psychroserpens algicola]|uniref:TIGR02206 family membrane protein n=1 Tax=Psychroserpens algicola TaxID=1719034 RepID=A0ABT0H6I5_9FLAO|nr:TIGR02206 family membrane protein [Psychroserpens algicola]MCK8479970.1 TIGR02206 family membrane protein [Psychroserpens algicola]
MINFYAAVSSRVLIGSWEHLLPIVFAFIVSVFLIRYARTLSSKAQYRLIHFIAVFISVTVIVFHIYNSIYSDYNFRVDLPLYLCSLLGILIPIYTYYKKYWMFEILIFWVIAGTLQGVITPDIAEGAPSFDYFRYWIVHLGLLLVIFYSIFVFKLKPKFKSIFKSFFALQLYVLLMITLNFILDANYFYLNEKPKSASVLDYFGDWPNYIIVCQLLIIPLFMIIYLPFYVHKQSLRK